MNKLDKFLLLVAPRTRLLIEKVIILVLSNNLSALDIKKLEGSKKNYRVRIGNVRIIFEKTKDGNNLLDISYRNDNTYRNF